MKREHYLLKQPMLPTPFDALPVFTRKLDNCERVITDNRYYYYLSPSFTNEKVQVKYLLK